MHVPELFGAAVAITLSFGCCLAYLFKKSFVTDSLAQASAEVGLLMGALGTLLGAIWAKPTWGAWWTWDPRLTSVAIMLVIYVGYLALRRFVEDPEKRATWSAVMGIIGFVDLPVVWFSVKWWRSMHQVQSSKGTMDPQMFMVWQLSIGIFLALTAVFVIQRFKIVYATSREEVALPEALPSAPQEA
jgi:heme exporter protein C